MTLHWSDKALCLNRLKRAIFRSNRALFRLSCFKKALHWPEKTDGGLLLALEGPFKPIKGPIQLTEALFLPRRALRWPGKALCLSRFEIALFRSKRALFGPFSALESPSLV